jgi:hypothetical protein
LFGIIPKIRRKIYRTVACIQFHTVIYNALCAAEDEHEVLENIALGIILSCKGHEIFYK